MAAQAPRSRKGAPARCQVVTPWRGFGSNLANKRIDQDIEDAEVTVVLASERDALRRTGWLHFYQMRHIDQPTQMPQLLCRGEGIRVFDDTEKAYIDGVSGAFCVNVGYGRQSILSRMHEAASSIHFVSPFLAGHPSGVQLSCRLSEMAAPLLGQDARVFFVNSGSRHPDLPRLIFDHSQAGV